MQLIELYIHVYIIHTHIHTLMLNGRYHFGGKY